MKRGLMNKSLMSSMTDMGKKGFRNKSLNSAIGTAILGFGLARIVMGTINFIKED